MISILSTNITSPLGFTTEQNYRAVRSGVSALKRYEGLWGLPEPFVASLFSEEQKAALALDGYTCFESHAIHSVREALSHTQLDVTSPKVILILSTTKGNIGQSPSEAAQRIAAAIGLTTKPIVVCNACVSGLSAQLLADHLLSAGFYDYAIVVGAEVQSKFIVSGFLSLKAVSDEPCRPFDIERNGLNPGEAAATIIFKKEASSNSTYWYLVNGATCNDAFHISSPSPQAEGLTAAIESVMKGQDKSEFASICVHGTATLYNDQMESKAIQRAGLSDIPLSALKGYYGHTMGAAGVLETILTMYATDDGIVLPSKGFTELGVSGDVRINMSPQPLSGGEKNAFLKILSGFGGCNVAAIYKKGFDNEQLKTDLRTLSAHLDAKASRNILRSDQAQVEQWRASHTVRITPTEVSVDGQRIPTSEIGEKMLTEIYNKQIGNYPKFHKMDILSRLAFVAAELLKFPSNSPVEGERHEVSPSSEGLEGSPIILFNHSSSIVADRQFLSTISDSDNFFPSPSVFVYTLPNIAAGELAIRHHSPGETSFYILPEKNDDLIQQILKASHLATNTTSVISGWIDAESETTFECNLSLIEK